MAADTVNCHTNKVFKTRLFVIKKRRICRENIFIFMTTDSVGCHEDYLSDNQQ